MSCLAVGQMRGNNSWFWGEVCRVIGSHWWHIHTGRGTKSILELIARRPFVVIRGYTFEVNSSLWLSQIIIDLWRLGSQVVPNNVLSEPIGIPTRCIAVHICLSKSIETELKFGCHATKFVRACMHLPAFWLKKNVLQFWNIQNWKAIFLHVSHGELRDCAKFW